MHLLLQNFVCFLNECKISMTKFFLKNTCMVIFIIHPVNQDDWKQNIKGGAQSFVIALLYNLIFCKMRTEHYIPPLRPVFYWFMCSHLHRHRLCLPRRQRNMYRSTRAPHAEPLRPTYIKTLIHQALWGLLHHCDADHDIMVFRWGNEISCNISTP